MRREVLEIQENLKRSRKKSASQSETFLGRYNSVKHMHTVNTEVFKDTMIALDVLLEFYPLFENRLLKDSEEIKTKLNTLNRRISKSVKERSYRR